MNIVFRVDSSVEMGSGHLMRCLTLADELASRGVHIWFVCRELTGNLCNLIDTKGYCVVKLPNQVSLEKKYKTQYEKWLGVSWEIDARQTQESVEAIGINFEWLIVDSYALDYRWQAKLRGYVKKIMVIDDLANREHDCDIVLDQNFYKFFWQRYDGLVSDSCYKLLGPQFALLRPEFRNARVNLRTRTGDIKHIFVFFGGSDSTNETLKVLQAIRLLGRPNIAVDVVLGKNYCYRKELELQMSKMSQVTIYDEVNNMSELMAKADLCIGAAGGTMWERCCMGLPSIVITIAENQIEATKDMADEGVLFYLEESRQINQANIYYALQKIFATSQLLRQYTDKSLEMVDGWGAIRCADELFRIYQTV